MKLSKVLVEQELQDKSRFGARGWPRAYPAWAKGANDFADPPGAGR